MSVSSSWLNKQLNTHREKELIRAHGHGLFVRIRTTGAISFIFRYRFDGKREKITFGSYPKMKLANAVEETRQCNAYMSEGKNPKTERKLEAIRYSTKYTVRVLAKEWWTNRYRDHPLFNSDVRGTPFNMWRSFELHVLPEYGDFAWDDVEMRAWSKLLCGIRDSSPHIALRLVTNIKSVGKYGVQHGLVNTNPIQGFSGVSDLGIKKKKGQRILSYEEIGLIFDALKKTRSDERTKIVFKLMIIYGCRGIELRLAEFSHFDFDRKLWTVPAELAKPRDLTDAAETANPIVRPILDEVLPLFRRLFSLSHSDKYLFPSSRTELDVPTVTDPWSYVPNRINMHIADENDGVTIPKWSKHDLRRSMRTHITRQTDEHGLGIEPWLAEKMIGHTLAGVFGVYDKGQYIPEKLRAYKMWYAVLDSIWNDKGDVVSIGVKEG